MHIIRSAAMALAVVLAGAAHAQPVESGTPTIQSVTAKYGKPDKIISNEFERPRVKAVSKSLVYRKQAVKFVFVPDAPDLAPPPYKHWKFVAVRDAGTDSALPEAEAEARMKPRLRAPRAVVKPESGAQVPAALR